MSDSPKKKEVAIIDLEDISIGGDANKQKEEKKENELVLSKITHDPKTYHSFSKNEITDFRNELLKWYEN